MLSRDKLNQLYRYGFALTADEQLAWDLVQDSAEKLISRAFVLNKVAYAKTVMRNKFYDLKKSKGFMTSVTLPDEIFPAEEDMEGAYDASLSVDELMKKLDSLDRELLFLWAVEEYTTKEISNRMNIPKGTITSRLKRLRDRLRKESGGER